MIFVIVLLVNNESAISHNTLYISLNEDECIGKALKSAKEQYTEHRILSFGSLIVTNEEVAAAHSLLFGGESK
jgi:hypothetical protein